MPRKARAALACGDGEERDVETLSVRTPIGEMKVCVCSAGLHMLYQKDEITDENFLADQRIEVALVGSDPQNEKVKSCLDDCLSWLNSYFHNVRSCSVPIPLLCPITSASSSFRDRVLMALVKSVPVGKTITYGELASLAGSPGAQRAVGAAMAANPFQLVVPCHRVVKSGLKVGKYSGGCRNSVKIWLLQHEGLSVDGNGTVSSL